MGEQHEAGGELVEAYPPHHHLHRRHELEAVAVVVVAEEQRVRSSYAWRGVLRVRELERLKE